MNPGVPLTPSDIHLLRSLLVGGSLGALVGLERQWDDQFRHHASRVLAGLRTFTLWALFGVLCAWFSVGQAPFLFGAGFVVVAVWMGFFLLSRIRAGRDPGFTTVAAGMITYLAGGLVFWNEARAAVILVVGVIILLALKPTFQNFTRGITLEDVRSALKFAAVSGIILPLVPDKAFGPCGSLNPRTIWMMVVLVSGVGFLGYLAVRLLGSRRGTVLTGLLGGLASSTATTLAMSRRSLEIPAESSDCSLAILLACTVMVPRVGLLVGIASPRTLMACWFSLASVSLPGLLWCLWRIAHGRSGGARPGDPSRYGNPLRLWPALQFGAVFALVVLVARMAAARLGDSGLLAVSGLSGLVDLDAISLSVSQMTNTGSIPPQMAARAILLAVCSNTLVKAAIPFLYGTRSLRKEVGAVLGITALWAVVVCRYAPWQ